MAIKIISQEIHKSPAKSNWQPQHIVDIGHGCDMGIAIDDHCFVVLYPTETGQWRPGKHIPKQVARQIGKLVKQGLLDY